MDSGCSHKNLTSLAYRNTIIKQLSPIEVSLSDDNWGDEAAERRPCHLRLSESMKRAIAYIDGYNLYYSRLKGTRYKWLDLVALFRDQILKPQLPEVQLDAVKYFTSPAKGKFASHGLDSVSAQNEYHRALNIPRCCAGKNKQRDSLLKRF